MLYQSTLVPTNYHVLFSGKVGYSFTIEHKVFLCLSEGTEAFAKAKQRRVRVRNSLLILSVPLHY